MVEQTQKRNNRKKSIIRLFTGILILFLINFGVSKIYWRLDVTTEKRYTLAPATIKLLKQLDHYAYFKVYLEGDFPAGFKKLRNETQDMLEEFKAYSPYIDYTFIDPSGIIDNGKRKKFIQNLISKGLQPTDLHVNKKEGSSRILIFPGLILNYNGREIAVDLLKTQMGVSPEKVLNHSIETLEYNLASALYKIVQKQKPSLAFLAGHGELSGAYIADIAKTLSESYRIGSLRIDERMSSLFAVDSSNKTPIKPVVDALVIAQPTQAFSEADKYIIDQYIMYGGKVFWLIDPVLANMDSLRKSSRTVAFDNKLNIEDQLFKYGIRLNKNLLVDLNARSIPIVTGMIGNQPQQELIPWIYFPILTPVSKHPIVRNLNSIMTEFPSTLDTVAVKNLKKTILLQSSSYSRLVSTPAIIDLALLEKQSDTREFHEAPQAVAALVEGQFTSLFNNRIPPKLKDNFTSFIRKNSSPKSAMIICSDGDLIKNQIDFAQHYPLPLGFDQFTRQSFGNKDFIKNSVNYLTQKNGLIAIRSREINLRLLDKTLVEQNILLIQFINVVLPLLLVLVFGLLFAYLRKRRFTIK